MDVLKGFILFAILIAIAMFISGNNDADLSADPFDDPCAGAGHPLDCW